MKIRSNHFKTLILSILLTACVAGNTQAADDALLKMLPGDCAFCVRINDLSGSLAKIDQYLIGIVPVGTAMLVNMQLAGIVGDPMLTGIEMNGTFAVVGLSDTQTVGLLVPVTHYAEFVKTNPNCKPSENGVTILDSPNVDMAMTEMAGGKYALLVPESQQDKLTALKNALTNTSNSLAGKLNAAQTQESAAAPVWAYVNLGLLYEKYSPMVMAEMEKAEQDMPAKMGSEMAEFGAFYVKMYMEMFKEFAGDADSATIALTPEAAALTFDTTLCAKDGSELARMLVADPTAKAAYTYTGYLDNTNAVNGLMKMNRPMMLQLYDKIFDILEKSKNNPSLTKQTAKMKELTHKMLPAMGDEVAFSFSYADGKPPFKLREVAAVKDVEKMKELMNDSMALADDFYAAMGLPMNFAYKPNTATYKNATIDQVVLTFPPSKDPNDPMQGVLEKMYGDNLTYTLAHSADRFYITMGADSEADIKKLIDRDAALPATGETKAALDLLQKTSYTDFVCSVNIIKLMTGLGDMMKNLDTAAMGGAPIPDIFGGLNVPTQSSLAIGGQVADGQIGMRTILPKQHLMEIMNAGMQMQKKFAPSGAEEMTPKEAPQSTQEPNAASAD